MSNAFEATKITDRVYWVGAIDWSIRDFHGYRTSRGTTYNAYLILAEKVVLVDTVRAPFVPEMLARIASVLPVEKIDYIVSNHAEMDHSGGLPRTIELAKPEKVFASKAGVAGLAGHFRPSLPVTPVADMEQLSLGNDSLTFCETKMLHWPDSMVSYLAGDQVLFSQDAFGMHLASTERFADELPEHILAEEAGKYYANIVLPFSPVVRKALDRLAELNLPTKVVAPDHGPIWRQPEDIGWILGRYGEWADGRKARKAVVVYETMWHSTEIMARAVAEGLAEGGVRTAVHRIASSHRSDIATDILDASALVVGSPTINNMMYPSIADVLCYLQGLAPKGLVGAAFGSYGWSGQATKQIAERLTDMKVELVGDPLRVQWVPDDEALAQCRALGRAVAQKVVAQG